MSSDPLLHGIGSDWHVAFNAGGLASLSGGSGRAAFYNNGTASRVWSFRSIKANLSGAGYLSLRVAANTQLTTLSILVQTPVHANVGCASAAFTTYGKCYYGTSAANSGLSLSTATTLHQVYLTAAGEAELAADGNIRLYPGYCLEVRGTPAAESPVNVWADIRILPVQVVKA